MRNEVYKVQVNLNLGRRNYRNSKDIRRWVREEIEMSKYWTTGPIEVVQDDENYQLRFILIYDYPIVHLEEMTDIMDRILEVYGGDFGDVSLKEAKLSYPR